MIEPTDRQRQESGATKPLTLDPRMEALLTRRRWDWYFLPATLIAVALGLFVTTTTGDRWILVAPVPMALLWLCTRFSTLPEGMRVRRMSADPDFVRLICWQILMLVLMLAVMAVDCYANGRAFAAPLEAYQLV
jgi:hypothetical protein